MAIVVALGTSWRSRSSRFAPSSVRLFIQRADDNYKADGGRWWSNPIAYRLANGATVLDVPLAGDQWSGVFGKFASEQSTAFSSTKASLRAIGFSFGGCFFAHGVYVTGGSARFSTIIFMVQ